MATPDRPTGPLSKQTAAAIAAATAIAVVGGLIGGLIVHSTSDSGRSTRAAVATVNAARCPAATIAADVLPSVVTLSVRGPTSSGSGSGEAINDDGYILTNDHVTSAGATGGAISVLSSSGESMDATAVGRSIDLDLAVVKVASNSDLRAISIGDSESLQVGQPVVALGAPLGLDGSVTSGIVSALGRDVSVPAANGQTARLPGAIQTDASINPGNSGGALVDCAGGLVGVNTAIATVPNAAGGSSSGSVGIGFAIPGQLAIAVADQLIKTGSFAPPFTGLSTIPIPPAMASRFDVTDGLFVQAVSAGGPANKAGLQVGDVIVEVDGHPTITPDSLWLSTLTKKAGDQVTVKYVRDGQASTTSLTLAPQP